MALRKIHGVVILACVLLLAVLPVCWVVWVNVAAHVRLPETFSKNMNVRYIATSGGSGGLFIVDSTNPPRLGFEVPFRGVQNRFDSIVRVGESTWVLRSTENLNGLLLNEIHADLTLGPDVPLPPSSRPSAGSMGSSSAGPTLPGDDQAGVPGLYVLGPGSEWVFISNDRRIRKAIQIPTSELFVIEHEDGSTTVAAVRDGRFVVDQVLSNDDSSILGVIPSSVIVSRAGSIVSVSHSTIEPDSSVRVEVLDVQAPVSHEWPSAAVLSDDDRIWIAFSNGRGVQTHWTRVRKPEEPPGLGVFTVQHGTWQSVRWEE